MTQLERTKRANERYLAAVALRRLGRTWSAIGRALGCSGPRAFILHRKGLRVEQIQKQVFAHRKSLKTERAAAEAEVELDRLMASQAPQDEIRAAAARLDRILGLEHEALEQPQGRARKKA